MSLIAQLEKETRVLRARDVAKLFQVTHQHVYKMAAGVETSILSIGWGNPFRSS